MAVHTPAVPTPAAPTPAHLAARPSELWRQTARRLAFWLLEVAVLVTLVAVIVGDVR